MATGKNMPMPFGKKSAGKPAAPAPAAKKANPFAKKAPAGVPMFKRGGKAC